MDIQNFLSVCSIVLDDLSGDSTFFLPTNQVKGLSIPHFVALDYLSKIVYLLKSQCWIDDFTYALDSLIEGLRFEIFVFILKRFTENFLFHNI